MSRLGLLSLAVLLTLPAFALPVDCQFDVPSLDQLINDPTYVDGCLVQDKLFTNFAYNQGSANNPDGTLVDTSFGLTLGAASPIGDLHEIRFTAIGSSWVDPFTISYTISLFAPTVPNLAIVGATFDLVVPGGTPGPTATKDLVGANAYQLNVSVGDPDTTIIQRELSLGVVMNVDPNGQAVTGVVDSYLQGIQVIPEPGTWALLGGGLMLIGAFRHRRNKHS